MSKLFSSEEIVAVLRKKGFVFISQRGSHAKLRRRLARSTLTVIVPIGRKEVPLGTFRSILRQSGLTNSDFE